MPQALNELITAVDLCMRDQLYRPTLILLFSGIDIAGWMAAEDPAMKVKDSFMAWVDKYLKPVDTAGLHDPGTLWGTVRGRTHPHHGI